MKKQSWIVPDKYDNIVPMYAGKNIKMEIILILSILFTKFLFLIPEVHLTDRYWSYSHAGVWQEDFSGFE